MRKIVLKNEDKRTARLLACPEVGAALGGPARSTEPRLPCPPHVGNRRLARRPQQSLLPRRPKSPWYADPAMSSEPAGVPAPPSPEEPLAQRVLRQARTGQLDEDRLLPGQDKRERDLTKKLDKLAAQAGWYTFVSAQAHAVATGKAPARRNAEIMVMQEVTRWRREVERFTPERLEEFEAGIRHALYHPAPCSARRAGSDVQVRPRFPPRRPTLPRRAPAARPGQGSSRTAPHNRRRPAPD